jgi:hypothetical protein
MPDTIADAHKQVTPAQELVLVHQEMHTMREYLHNLIEATLTGQETTDEWVDIEVLRNLRRREQALNEELFAAMPYEDPIDFKPVDHLETEKDVEEQIRGYIEVADPENEGFDATAIKKPDQALYERAMKDAY